MDATATIAIVTVATTIASVIAAALSSRGQIGIKALELATATYQADNHELRTRVFAAEQHVIELTAQVNRCESDKSQLLIRVSELERREKR